MVNREYEAQAQDSELGALLSTLPFTVRQSLYELPNLDTLVEVVLDLGRPPQARFPEDFVFLGDTPITHEDLAAVEEAVSAFGTDNRAGIESTLHRISAIRNRSGKIVGFTCRVGRAVFGTIDIILDVVRSGKSICLLGPPGVGKTTILRECARVLSEDRKRVVIVDTSNEIGGDGDIPHPGIGHARRMQVADAAVQHRVMVEAVENHMPEVIVIDEIGSELEALAARTIAERGVQLIGTAHGKTLENLLMNPTLSDLVGGIESVTLSDEEARRRETRKTVLERKAPPTFDILIEIDDRNRFSIHSDVAEAVDTILGGHDLSPEVRQRGFIEAPVDSSAVPAPKAQPVLRVVQEPEFAAAMRIENRKPPVAGNKATVIFPYGISHAKLRSAIDVLGLTAEISHTWDEADMVFTLKDIERKASSKLATLASQNVPIVSVKANTGSHIEAALKGFFNRTPGRRAGRRDTDPVVRGEFKLRPRKQSA